MSSDDRIEDGEATTTSFEVVVVDVRVVWVRERWMQGEMLRADSARLTFSVVALRVARLNQARQRQHHNLRGVDDYCLMLMMSFVLRKFRRGWTVWVDVSTCVVHKEWQGPDKIAAD
jgi:hypothetical protein